MNEEKIMIDDKISEIRARHDAVNNVLRGSAQMHDDRGYLLTEVDRLRGILSDVSRDLAEDVLDKQAEIDRLTRQARKESDRLYTECGQLWDEYKKMCEVIRTIGARCVELDDSDAVSAILDITEKILGKDKP